MCSISSFVQPASHRTFLAYSMLSKTQTPPSLSSTNSISLLMVMPPTGRHTTILLIIIPPKDRQRMDATATLCLSYRWRSPGSSQSTIMLRYSTSCRESGSSLCSKAATGSSSGRSAMYARIRCVSTAATISRASIRCGVGDQV